jgi:hypothetical protein
MTGDYGAPPMPSDRTLNTAEQAWIAKYRAALNEVPAPRSRFEGIATFFRSAKSSIVAKVDKLFAKSSPAPAPDAVVAASDPVPALRRPVRAVGQRSRKELATSGSARKRRKRVSAAN